ATFAIQLEDGAGNSVLLNSRHADSKAKWLDTLRKVTQEFQKQRFRRLSFDKAKYGRRKQVGKSRIFDTGTHSDLASSSTTEDSHKVSLGLMLLCSLL